MLHLVGKMGVGETGIAHIAYVYNNNSTKELFILLFSIHGRKETRPYMDTFR